MSDQFECLMRYRRANHLAWRALGEETLVVDLRANRMFGLNETGGLVWQALEESGEPADLAASLGLGGREIERALMPIEAFLVELHSADLVEATATSEPMSRNFAKTQKADGTFVDGTFVPPAIVFREEIRNFGQSTSMVCFGDPSCDQGGCG